MGDLNAKTSQHDKFLYYLRTVSCGELQLPGASNKKTLICLRGDELEGEFL